MNCLLEEDFNRYIDRDLAEAELEQFVAHIASCQSCRERLNEMEQMELRIREDFAGCRLQTVRPIDVKPFSCPSEQDLFGYLGHELSPPEMDGIERHLQDCDKCVGQLRIFSRIKTSLQMEDLEPVPRELKSMVLQKWNQEAVRRGEVTPDVSTLRLAIRLVATGLEILRNSVVPADMVVNLVPLPNFAGAFRSSESAPASGRNEVVVAKKQITDKDLDIELVIRKESDQLVSLALKLSKGESPFPDARVSLLKDRSLFHSKKTDSNGHVQFVSIPAGDYVLKISGELIQWPIEIKDH